MCNCWHKFGETTIHSSIETFHHKPVNFIRSKDQVRTVNLKYKGKRRHQQSKITKNLSRIHSKSRQASVCLTHNHMKSNEKLYH